MSTSFPVEAVLDDYLDYYAQENSSWTEVRDGRKRPVPICCQVAYLCPPFPMWVLDIQLVQSKQRMTEIIKHATSEEVSGLFDCEGVAADSAHDPTCLICCACNNVTFFQSPCACAANALSAGLSPGSKKRLEAQAKIGTLLVLCDAAGIG